MPEEDKIAHAASALAAGQWENFERHLKDAFREHDEEVWVKLAALHPAAVDLIAALSQISPGNERGASTWLMPAIGKLPSVTPEQVWQVLKFSDRLTADYRLSFASQLAPHMAKNPRLGERLGSMLQRDDGDSESKSVVWSIAFATGAPAEAADYAGTLLHGTTRHPRLVVFLTNALPTRSDSLQRIVIANEAVYVDAIRSCAADLGETAWTAMCQIAPHSCLARNELRELLDSPTAATVVPVARTLSGHTDPTTTVTGTSLNVLVRQLLALGIRDASFRPAIDHAVAGLLYSQTCGPVAVRCIADLRAVDADAVECYGAVFNALAERPTEFASVMSDWLLHPDTHFRTLQTLLSRCASGYGPARLDERAFKLASPERRVKAARRLLALCFSGPALCQFSNVIANMTSLGRERLQLSDQMFHHSFVEFPGATEEFLRSTVAEIGRGSEEAWLYRHAYAKALRWRRVLVKLPPRLELRPTDVQTHALRARDQRLHREIHRTAGAMSAFSESISSVHIAQGRKFASHSKGGLSRITDMTEQHHSIELPSSQRADPMRGLLQRNALLRQAR